MDLNLQGLRVLVTAGASGIGLATARAFAREGASVHVCDLDDAALRALAASDPTLSRSTCDVAAAASVGAVPGGLTFQRLLDDPHGVDLGPLEPRVPNVLSTTSGPLATVVPPPTLFPSCFLYR